MQNVAEKIVRDFQERHNSNEENQNPFYSAEFDSLSRIQKKFDDENFSDAVQSAKKKAWEGFQKLWSVFEEAQKSDKIPAEVAGKIDAEMNKIYKRVFQEKYSMLKGYDELKKLLFGVVDIGTSSLEYRNDKICFECARRYENFSAE